MTTIPLRRASFVLATLAIAALGCEPIQSTFDPNAPVDGDAATAADAPVVTDSAPAADATPATGHEWHFRFTFPGDFMVASSTVSDVFDARGNALVSTCHIEGQTLDCTWREPADPPASRWSIHTRLNFPTPSTPEARTDFYVPGWWGTHPETPVVLGNLTLVEVNGVRVVCDVVPNGLAAPRNGYNFGNCHLPVADAGAPVTDAGVVPAADAPVVTDASADTFPVADAGMPVVDAGAPVDVAVAPRNCALPSGATCSHGGTCVTGTCADSAHTPISVTCNNGVLSAPTSCPMTTVTDAGTPGTDMVTVTAPAGWSTTEFEARLFAESSGAVSITCTNNSPAGSSVCSGSIVPPFRVSTRIVGTSFPGIPDTSVRSFYDPGIWTTGGSCSTYTSVRVTLTGGRTVSCATASNGRGGCDWICR